MPIEAFTPGEMAAAERVLRNVLRADFSAFVEKTFVCPGQPFRPNWHRNGTVTLRGNWQAKRPRNGSRCDCRVAPCQHSLSTK